MRKLSNIVSVVAVAALTLGASAFPVGAESVPLPTQQTVRPADIRPASDAASGDAGWYREVSGTASALPTDSRPYNNQGSLEFNVEGANSYAEIALYSRLPSHRLSDLAASGLSYATWQTADAPQAVALQINADLDVTDAYTGWQGRLVYEPYMGNVDTMGRTITKDTWQTWVASESDAKWWMTWSAGATAQYGMTNPCPQSDPCTTAEIVNVFPDAGFNTSYGNGLILKAGSGWNSFVGYADVPYVGDTTNTYWDFEPESQQSNVPTNKDQCKGSGWTALTAADGTTFKNQGSCVSYVAAKKSD